MENGEGILKMQILERKISDIKPYAKNPRKNDSAVDYVANSIKEFGFKVPIVIDKDGIIIAGHTRLKAAKKLGMETVPCIMADDLTDEQVKAFRLADNKVAEFADWDNDMLAEELGDILDIDMEPLGFDLDMFDDEEKLEDIKEVEYKEKISVVIDCESDAEAEEIFDALTEEGYTCRILTL